MVQYAKKLQNLLDWLVANSKTSALKDELDKVDFKYDDLKGLGCFANVDFAKGDILFSIPRKCIIGYNTAKFNDPYQQLRSLYQELRSTSSFSLDSSWTCEFVIFLYMIEQIYGISEETCFHRPYLTSLEFDNIPCILSWPNDLKECFEGTNLKPTLDKAEHNLIQKLELLKKLLGRYEENKTNHELEALEKRLLTLKKVDLKSLTWAWTHYVSRRYPGHFAPVINSSSFSSSSFDEQTSAFCEGREEGLENLGSLVPLLDILNHDCSDDWLTFQVKEEELLVICNRPVQKGCELFSNYGKMSNEMLLFAYGFCIPDNESDSVAVKLVQKTSTGTHSHLFHIEKGGFDGIPIQLWTTLSEMLDDGNDGDNEAKESSVNDENERIAQIDIGVDELEMLHDYLEKRLNSLTASQTRTDEILWSYSNSKSSNNHSAKKKKKEVFSNSTITGTVSGSDSGTGLGNDSVRGNTTVVDNIDAKLEWIQIYRQGQESILIDTINVLSELLDSTAD